MDPPASTPAVVPAAAVAAVPAAAPRVSLAQLLKAEKFTAPRPTVQKLKIKGRAAVEPYEPHPTIPQNDAWIRMLTCVCMRTWRRGRERDSGLADVAHVLEHDGAVYSAVLSMSDISTGVNSYYKLQVLEYDKRAGWYGPPLREPPCPQGSSPG